MDEREYGAMIENIKQLQKDIDEIKQNIKEIRMVLYNGSEGGIVASLKILAADIEESKKRKTNIIYWMIGISSIIAGLISVLANIILRV